MTVCWWAVAWILDLSRETVRKHLTADSFPEMAPRRMPPSILDPHRADLAQRRQEGNHNGRDLLRALRERGYTDERSIVADAVRAPRFGGHVGDLDSPFRRAIIPTT